MNRLENILLPVPVPLLKWLLTKRKHLSPTIPLVVALVPVQLFRTKQILSSKRLVVYPASPLIPMVLGLAGRPLIVNRRLLITRVTILLPGAWAKLTSNRLRTPLIQGMLLHRQINAWHVQVWKKCDLVRQSVPLASPL